MSVRSDVDELIDWYEQNSPQAGRVIHVVATRSTVKKFARKQGKRGGPWMYREREIVPVRKPLKERREQAPHQHEVAT